MNAGHMLMYLENVSNGNLTINLINHFIVIVGVILCLSKIKSKEKIILGTIILMCISLVGNAFYYGNIFHLITFGIMLIFSVVIFLKNKEISDVPKREIYTAIAAVFILLGIWYPEFTHVNIVLSLMLSPLGLVPCPTLLTVGGILNLYPDRFNKGFCIYTIALIIIYGIIGTFVFKVYYDVFLLLLAVFSIVNLRRKI